MVQTTLLPVCILVIPLTTRTDYYIPKPEVDGSKSIVDCLSLMSLTLIDLGFNLVFGTSASAPTLGSIITLINDARIAAGKGPVGLYDHPVDDNTLLIYNQDLSTPLSILSPSEQRSTILHKGVIKAVTPQGSPLSKDGIL